MIQDGTRRDEEDIDKGERLGGGSQSSPGLSPSGNVSTSNSQAPTSSGRYTNLSRYIDKNRGATNQTLNKAKSDISSLENNVQSTSNNIRGIADAGINEYGSIRSNQDAQRSAANDPYSMGDNVFQYNTSVSRDQINRLNPEIERMNSFNPQKEALSSLSQQGGVRNYLDSIRGNRPGSAGGTELDTFLLSSTPESQKDLGDISKRASSINLDSSPQTQRLESAYSQLSGYDPNIAKGQIQNRLQNDLDINSGGSVDRYNRIQEMLGNPTRAQFVMRPIEIGTVSGATPTGTFVPMGAPPGSTANPGTNVTQTGNTPQTGSGNVVPAGRPGTTPGQRNSAGQVWVGGTTGRGGKKGRWVSQAEYNRMTRSRARGRR